MSSKGRIDDIIDVPAVKKQIDYLTTALDAINKKFGEYAGALDKVVSNVKGAKGMADLNTQLEKQATITQQATKAQHSKSDINTKIIAEEARLTTLMNGGAAAEVKLLTIKQQRINREKELLAQAKEAINAGAKQTKSVEEQIAAAKRQVNSIRAIEEETKKLQQIKKDLILVEGKESTQVREINSMIDKNTNIIRENSDAAKQQSMNVGNYGSVWDGVKGTLAAAALAMGSLSGVIAFGKSVIESTGATAREFKAVTTGMSWAWDEFKKAIATSDFSNLLTNMGNAITAGREYVNILADVKKSTRALSITNSELNLEFQKQKVIERDVSKTTEERIASGKKALDIELKMTEESMKVGKKAFDAELLHLRTITKLKDDDIKTAVSTYNSNEKNLDLANEYNKALETTSAKNSQAASQTRKTPEGEAAYQKTVSLVKSASPEIKKLAGVMKAMGKTTGEELDAMAQKWVDLINIESESVQKTARVKITLGRLEKGIIDEGIKEEAAKAKEIDKQITAYDKLSNRIKELNDKMIALRMANQPVPNSMIHELISSQDKLEKVKKEVEDIAAGMIAIQSKGYAVDAKGNSIPVASSNPTSGAGLLKPRAVDWKAANDKGSSGSFSNTWDSMSSSEQANVVIEATQSTSDAAFDIIRNNDQAILDGKLADLEKEKNAKLANTHLSEKQKAKIEEEYAKKTAKAKTDAAKKEKAAAIIQAIINTALAIGKVAGNPVLMALAAVVGAAQIAIIASQPIPKYFKGREGGKAEFAWVGERGTEAIQLPGGKTMLTPDHATMTYLPAGANVIPNERLLKMSESLTLNNIPQYEGGISTNDIKELKQAILSQNANFEMINNTFKHKKEVHINLDKNGIETFIMNGSSRADYINNNIRF